MGPAEGGGRKGAVRGFVTVSELEDRSALRVAASARGRIQGAKPVVGELQPCQKAARGINSREVSICVFAPDVDSKGGFEGSKAARPDLIRAEASDGSNPSVLSRTCSCCGQSAKMTLTQPQT